MLTVGQVKAALVLLKKPLLDLSHVEVETTTHRTLDQLIIDSYQYDAEFSGSSEDLSDEMQHCWTRVYWRCLEESYSTPAS
jgi:hypothetical protein